MTDGGDPDTDRLHGWLRQGGALVPIIQMNQWVSPRLDIRFDTSGNELVIYRSDGQRFLTSVELEERAELAETQLAQERQRTERLAEYLRSLGVDPDKLPPS
jgi:hypothetical protein